MTDENFKLGKETIWRADSWLFISAAGGDVSILMPRKTILAFSFFLRSIILHPHSHHFAYGGLRFDSEDIESYQARETVVVLVGGKDFVYTFAIDINKLDDLASYLESNCEDDEDEFV